MRELEWQIDLYVILMMANPTKAIFLIWKVYRDSSMSWFLANLVPSCLERKNLVFSFGLILTEPRQDLAHLVPKEKALRAPKRLLLKLGVSFSLEVGKKSYFRLLSQ